MYKRARGQTRKTSQFGIIMFFIIKVSSRDVMRSDVLPLGILMNTVSVHFAFTVWVM